MKDYSFFIIASYGFAFCVWGALFLHTLWAWRRAQKDAGRMQ